MHEEESGKNVVELHPEPTPSPPPAGPGASIATAEAVRAVNESVARGDLARNARSWVAAREAYSQALAVDPMLQPIWVQLGHAAKESGDLYAAETAYRKAIELKPDDADAHLQLGHLLKLRGLSTAALDSYSSALRLQPDLMDARNELIALESRLTSKPAPQAFGNSSFGLYAVPRRNNMDDVFTVVFDISDLMHYFHNARLPTGIQRVQIEVIKNALEANHSNFNFCLVCFTKETDFWIEIPQQMFQVFCKEAVSSGDMTAPEWVTLLADLKRLLQSKKYFRFPKGSLLLNLGTSWWLQNYFLNVRMAKSLYSVKYIPFVHDFIPAMTPEHCVDELRQDFNSWAIGAFDHADHFLVNSKATLNDLRAVANRLGHPVPDAQVVTLDADFRKSLESVELLDPTYLLYTKDLQKENYVLFVATIESRKNHIAAFSVWLKLLKKYGAKNVPKLVCVGNDGWLNDAAYSKLRASELLSRHVIMLQKISDAALAVLYENCLCTLYPSSYEGWGLPVTEALCFGKLPIISNSSSLPEAGGEFAEYFDVDSEKDLMAAVERVIFDDEYRRERERKIVASFQPRSWAEISREIIEHLRSWHAPAGRSRQSDEDESPMSGIWPVQANLNELHMLSGNTSSMLWPGLQSGEIYRNGTGWWWPETWGSWIKGTGPAYVAFKLDDAKDSSVLVYLGLRGVQGKHSTCTLKTPGAPSLEIILEPDQDKVVKLRLPPKSAANRLVVISVTCNAATDFGALTNGVDTRIAGVGVRWFYACKENDIIGRLNLLEGLSVDAIERLQRQPPPERDFLLAAQ
jgi:glycosyltransferase involved in cell wall biosynthesis